MHTRRNTSTSPRKRTLLVLAAASMTLAPLGSGAAHASDGVAGSPTTSQTGHQRPRPTLVAPRPGMDNVHPIAWDSVQPRGQHNLRVFFTSGVAPCSVLDHVQVDYGRRQIVVTLFEGSDPKARDQACISIAEFKATDVKLAPRARGRRIVDGSRSARPEPARSPSRST